MLNRIGMALALIALCAISILRVARPPAVVPATAPDTVFSAERAMRHVEQIAVRPHAIGMADHDRVRDYILAELNTLGLRTQVQTATAIGTRYQAAGRVQNILAWIPGNGPKSKAVLLMAHYDGVEAGPAAADDGAGSAALLETLRALRASKTPLAHDVFAVFTDGEEAGLLGAAAFVREHPWAKDVGFALNFEARGTTGRSLMFETGPGNLDAARALRSVRSATAGSVYTAVYRKLPNDTDLSELALLGVPALNFAFADGVERYHTSHDDVPHLDAGSVQHHGMQMLQLARTLADGPMPRPETGDADFFDLPIIGLVVYPEWLAIPLAIAALVLVVLLVVRDRKGIAAGVAAALVALIVAAAIGQLGGRLLTGPAMWSGLWALAFALFSVAITLACWVVAAQWSTPRGLLVGAMIVWLVLALATAFKAPGAAYLFVWPLLFAAGAALLTARQEIGEWFTAVVTLLLLPGLAYGVAVVMLGVTGIGAIALAVLTVLVAIILAPLLLRVAGGQRWLGAHWVAIAGVVVAIIAMLTVKTNDAHPIRTSLAYAEHADGANGWLGAFTRTPDAWTRSAIGTPAASPEWTHELVAGGNRFAGRSVPRAALAPPTATLVRDTLLNGNRRVVLRVTGGAGTTGLLMRARGAKVVTSSIDGRVVDTTRYRYQSAQWTMEYMAPSDSGAVVALSIPAGAQIDFDLVARHPGLPPIGGVTIPPRPKDVVPSQTGDVSYVYRTFHF